jgi:CubicO group peptidase (beta-lactamase class C family)
MLKSFLFVILAAIAVAQPLPLSTPEREGLSAERLKRMHAALDQLTKEGKRSGAISMVVRNGKIADWQTFGFRDIDGKLPMEKDTICRIYSMSKPITSVAILMLLEEGKLNLNDRLDKFAPEFADIRVFEGGTFEEPTLVAPKRPITIKHLLTHTSGMVYGNMSSSPAAKFYASVFQAPTLKDFIGKVVKAPLVAHPGDEYNYGISTDVLGYVVQVIADMPFEQFLEKRVFTPLKMKDTFFNVPEEKNARAAKLYIMRNSLEVAPPPPNRSMPSGGGGLQSTIGDYARFAQMLLNGGQLDGVRIVGRKTVELMMQNHLNHMAKQTIANSDFEGFGLGGSVRLDIAKGNRPGSVGEFGWDGAASTHFRIDPTEKMIRLLFLQHFPFDGALHHRFATLVYQSIAD